MISPKLFLYRLKKRVQSKLPAASRPAGSTPVRTVVPGPTPKKAPLVLEGDGGPLSLDLTGLSSEAVVQLISRRVVSLEDLSDQTLGSATRHYQSLGLHKEALSCQRIRMERTTKNATIHSYAKALFAAGDARAALAKLDEINQDNLTDRGQTLFMQDRFAFLRALGRVQEAYALLEAHALQLSRPDMTVEVRLAEMERQRGDVVQAFNRLSGQVAQFGKNTTFLQNLSGCLGEMNRNDEALLVAGLLCAEEKPTTPHVARYIDLLWQQGAVDQLYDFLNRITELRMMHPSLLKSVREKAHASARIATLIPELELNVGATLNETGTENLVGVSERLYALEMFAEAKTAASRYIAFFNQNPSAYFIRGACAFYLGDYETAERDLLRCVALNPGFFLAYGILLNVLPRRMDGVKKLADLLEIRNAAQSKYTAYGPDGRRGLLDIEGSQLAFMQGDFMKGQKIRQERPVCRYLQTQFPDQYDCFETPDFPAEQKDSLLVITEDGVGDEVRWSQYLPQLKEHYKSVEVTCDPRLHSLLARSFPDVTFYPFKRRLMERADTQEVNPSSNVPYFSLARVIDNTLYARLDSYSELRFSADVVRGAWAKNPNRQPLPDGPPDKAYLVPDKKRVTKWRKTLAETGGDTLKVGLVWRSSFITPRRRKHYLELANITQLLAVRGVQFYSLQADHSDEERLECRRLGILIPDGIDLQDELEEVAALSAALDLVVTVNSFLVEMASAVGTPCWMLGFYSNLVRFRLGDSTGETDRLSPNVTILRADREAGFTEDDGALQRKLAGMAKEKLTALVKASATREQGSKG